MAASISMTPDTGYSNHPIQDSLQTLWLLKFSIAIFIGQYGEARVGSGSVGEKCKGSTKQKINANCTGELGVQNCSFYTTSNNTRRYLAMRDSGALETLAVPDESWTSHLEKLRAPPIRNRPRFETLFRVEPHPSFSCDVIANCTAFSLSSVSTGMYVRVGGNPLHKNLTKLHHKALTLKSEQGRKGMCLKNPGPFHQQPTVDSSQASPFMFTLEPPHCVPFTEFACGTGSLRASYPIQNPVRAGSKWQ